MKTRQQLQESIQELDRLLDGRREEIRRKDMIIQNKNAEIAELKHKLKEVDEI